MKKITGFLSLAAMLLSPAQVIAQQVGTIGMGEITFSADTSAKLRPTNNVVTTLSSDINSALTKTRKFTVLDYSQLKARIDEQGRSLNGYYTKQYTGNAVTQAGLDYILKADVTEFGLFKQTRSNSENTIGLVDIDFQLVGVADATNDFSSSVTAQFSTRIEAGDEGAAQELLDKAIQQAVDQLVDGVISNLFPIRVMKIDDNGTITLNYGEGLLEAGDTVLIYPIDAGITVDASGKAVGDAIATLQVITSERKFAIAQALNGQEGLEKGQKGQLILTGG